MAAHLGSIAVEASKTRRRLQELCLDIATRAQSAGLPDRVEIDPQDLTDCLDQFNIWAGSLCVSQRGEASLDFRISGGGLAQEVLRLLHQLYFFTSELQAIVNGSRGQTTWTKESLHNSSDESSDLVDSSDEEIGGILTPRDVEDDENRGIFTEANDLVLSVN
ncbi:uncharacterized protein Z519_06709 [Cladophialophora bantiana CBS 173.52]|uniref:Uncharacterized protein n=1 Tax=Cladophialophora bantiana (strain ATCC 10958 / CBS 173.52 / CDC B-1940 / NIH 8579) TaxID=1442370 RepID=A0A0D2HPT4_CLAB1|nr:uncharacterized protein Z519_06709 [Cladophialophora bantiana CBS 173.52]KIW92860.1 hypothetical protein Z519_06709 [Cladophialophora bantiana CBS 173.52]